MYKKHLKQAVLLVLSLAILSGCKVQTIRLSEQGIKKEYQQIRKTKVQQGFYKEYYPDGALFVEKRFENGLQCGIERQFFPDGNLKAVFNYTNGLLDGPFIYYHTNGHIYQEGTYTEDNIEGPLLTYYPNGQLKENICMLQTIENGTFVEYFETGAIKTEGFYLDGKEHGLLKIYAEDASGVLQSKMYCKNGICCTFWTAQEGSVQAANELCTEIFEEIAPNYTDAENN